MRKPPSWKAPIRLSSRYLRFDRRQYAGVQVRGQREVAVRTDLPMIWHGDLEPFVSRIAEVGHQPAASRRRRRRGDAEDRQQRQVDPEQLQPSAFEMHPLLAGSSITRAAVIDQLGRFGQPLVGVTGQGE